MWILFCCVHVVVGVLTYWWILTSQYSLETDLVKCWSRCTNIHFHYVPLETRQTDTQQAHALAGAEVKPFSCSRHVLGLSTAFFTLQNNNGYNQFS